jgi:hypothetical protein
MLSVDMLIVVALIVIMMGVVMLSVVTLVAFFVDYEFIRLLSTLNFTMNGLTLVKTLPFFKQNDFS